MHRNRNGSIVYRSADGGSSWVTMTSSPGATITNLATDPLASGVLYATIGTYTNSKVLKSSDLATTWINISNNLPNVPVNCLVVDPFDNLIIYAGNDLGVWVTQNGGNNLVGF